MILAACVPGGDDFDMDFTAGAPGQTPVLRIPVRMHMDGITKPLGDYVAVFTELNAIWYAQAGVCFEIETVAQAANRQGGFDLVWRPGAPPAGQPNGQYSGDHNIFTYENPRLGAAPTPVAAPGARTAAHELGHALTLQHNEASDNNLLRSGTLGYQLSQDEVTRARTRAQQVALADRTATNCAQPVFHQPVPGLNPVPPTPPPGPTPPPPGPEPTPTPEPPAPPPAPTAPPPGGQPAPSGPPTYPPGGMVPQPEAAGCSSAGRPLGIVALVALWTLAFGLRRRRIP